MNKDFLWGSATASYQCEGAWNLDDKVESMWDVYLHENNLENGDNASDFYHHFEEDLLQLKNGGQNAFRMSLAWPRIIKNKEGEVNSKGVDFYRKILQCCLDKDITPFVTFNEPKWFVSSGYLIGNYPPAHKNPQEMIIAAYHVMLASALGVKIFKEGGYKGQIGIVHSFTPVNGVDDSLETRIAMRYADNYCNNWILDTACQGEFPIDLLSELNKKIDLSFINIKELDVIKENTVDFIGLNYYARALIRPYSNGETVLVANNSGNGGSNKVIIKDWFEQVFDDPDAIYTEWGTEICPLGLEQGLKEVWNKYHLPLYISENGIGVREDVTVDEVQDDYRISYMNDHIAAMMNAMDDGVDMRGYFAWSTFDLYSWKNGCEKRYGLVAIDFDTPNLLRKPKKSYYWYKEIIESKGKKIERKRWD